NPSIGGTTILVDRYVAHCSCGSAKIPRDFYSHYPYRIDNGAPSSLTLHYLQTIIDNGSVALR
ncbi:hypothetical protein ACKVWM_011643, partial [Pyricularia oryzae]